MRKVAFIPARSGSKRFPNKNVSKLDGKPLISWAVNSFLLSNCFDRVIFSSDSEEYFQILKEFVSSDILEFHKRSKDEAGDKIKIFDYVKENIKQWCKDDDYFVLGLPTCPFRKPYHVKECLDIAIKKDTSVFSACEYDFHVPFAFSLKYENDEVIDWDSPFNDSPLISGNTRSQDQKKYFHPNGAIYVLKPNFFAKDTKTFYQNSIPYVMSRNDSIDIDEKEDLDFAEFFIERIN